MTLEEILGGSTYQVSKGWFSVAKVDSTCPVEKCFLVTKDEIETTAVYNQEQSINGILEEKRDYVLIAINVALPFYAPGFIAAISSAFAEKGISVLVVSTYSRDYFMVHKSNKDVAVSILDGLHLCQKKDGCV